MAKKDVKVKKRWVQVVAPPVLGSKNVGEVLVATPEDAVGKHITLSLASIEGGKQTVDVDLIIDKKDGNNLSTVLNKYFIIPAALKRMVRRNRSKISDSFVVKLNDGAVVRLKFLLVTRNAVSGSVATSAYHFLRSWAIKESAKLTFDELVKGVITKKFQKALQGEVKKLAPLQICEVRYLELLTGEKAERARVLKLAVSND